MKRLTLDELQRRDRSAAIISVLGLAGLLWDFGRAWEMRGSSTNLLEFVAGPVFHHKISELAIATAWILVSVMFNHHRANLWPRWMPAARYATTLRFACIVMTFALVSAVYAWTAINLGTSASTTDVQPVRTNLLIWRGYLGLLVVAAGLFPLIMGPLSVRLAQGGRDAGPDQRTVQTRE